MADEKTPESPFTLNRTRIVLLVMIVAALAISATSIVGSLGVWREHDVAPEATETP